MPIYQYKCPQNHYFEEERPMTSESTLTSCEICGEALKKVYSAPVINLVGRGFYRNGG